jgi:anti-sigma factor RsiW
MSENDLSKCHSLLGSLSDFVDGTLDEELCEEIKSHITECQNCRVVVDTLRKTISLYHESAAESGEVPGVVCERLFRTLNLEDYLRH